MIYDSVRNDEVKYCRDIGALEQRRRKGMTLLAKGFSQSEVARMVGVSRMSVMRWERLRNDKRNGAWKRRKLGRPPKSKRVRLKAKEVGLFTVSRKRVAGFSAKTAKKSSNASPASRKICDFCGRVFGNREEPEIGMCRIQN